MFLLLFLSGSTIGQPYVMPSEEEPHLATWLQWPHNFGWDTQHIRRYEAGWMQMTKALTKGENVYVIVYNQRQKKKSSKKDQKAGSGHVQD